MKPTKVQLKAVIKEIENLKEYTTKEEKGILNFKVLKPLSPELCIYGQMTGDCDSKRAVVLLKQCAVKWVAYQLLENTFKPAKSRKGQKTMPTALNISWGGRNSFSALEHFIVNFPEHNKNILGYIKGTSKNLKLKKLLNNI